ncbi:MAG: hypothetical protein RIC24_04880 [Hyphomicrobiales bacterium]|jgi:hypothetical protein
MAESLPTNERVHEPQSELQSAPLHAALREVLRLCDADRLARHLGLRSAAAAESLRANEAALDHLTLRLAEGCDGLSADEAASSTKALFKGTNLGTAGDG